MLQIGMRSLVVVVAVLALPPTIHAQSLVPPGPDSTVAVPLEQQIQTLRAEIARLTAATEPPARTHDVDDLARLGAELQELDQRVRIALRNLEIEREQAAALSAAQPRVTAGRDGFSLQSADGNFRMRFRGYVHADGRFYPDGSTLITPSTFVLRRVRPVFDATVFRTFDFRIMPDFGGGTTVLQDAYIDARFKPVLKIRAGKFKSPFGLERLVSAVDLTFIERGAPTLLAPNRDLGVMVHGEAFGARVAYQAALMNGVVDGGSADIDDRKGKDVILRVFAEPFKRNAQSPLKGLGIGVATSFGDEIGSGTVTGLPTFRTAGNHTFFRYRTDTTPAGTAFANGDRLRASAQGYWYYRSFGVLAELTASRQDVSLGTALQSLTNTASVVSGSFFLTGEAAAYGTVMPRRELGATRGAWGALEVTGRFTRLAVDDDAFPIFANPALSAGTANEWAAGINWYLNRFIKYSLSFHETRFDGGAPNGGDRRTEHDLLVRVQFAF
jgi:phosphate-selective porin OprO/OprP